MSVLAIAGVIAEGLKLINKYIDDPKRRAKASQEYFDACKRRVGAILDEKDAKRLDDLLLEFIAHIHNNI